MVSAYDVHAEVEAPLLPDIEAALDGRSEDWPALRRAARLDHRIETHRTVASLRSPEFSPSLIVTMCNEINSSFRNGNLVATILLMRAVLNYVPPVFGRDTFPQVVANSGRSLRDSFDHLENGLRKVADFHTHRRRTRPICLPLALKWNRSSLNSSCCSSRSSQRSRRSTNLPAQGEERPPTLSEIFQDVVVLRARSNFRCTSEAIVRMSSASCSDISHSIFGLWATGLRIVPKRPVNRFENPRCSPRSVSVVS